MKIHHLNLGCMCPVGGVLYDGFSPTLGSSLLSCHCLLVETDNHGLVLVDTGISQRELTSPGPRLAPFFRGMCRPELEPGQSAIEQVRARGFSPRDVRHILLTHLDFDHAGGIEDFPEVKVHLLASEKQAALQATGWIQSRRYRPAQFENHHLWQTYEPSGERWFDFDAVREIRGLPPEFLFVPLPGHTVGHAGIAIDTDTDGWLLHAGDAYFYRGEMQEHPSCTPGLRFYQWMMDTIREERIRNQQRLRALVGNPGNEVTVFCAHDFKEFEQLVGQAEAEKALPHERRHAA